MSEYKWIPLHVPEPGVSRAFKLEAMEVGNFFRVRGYLKKGGRKRQGWFVHDFWALLPITRLPHTLTEDEAKDAAKTILLSLEESS